jgi:nucleoside-diphosphate-sugar epimerase
VYSGNIKLAMSHVVPDLVQKVLKGQYPLHILGRGNQVRHYTYGGDLAKGIRLCVERKNAINEDFNLSTKESISVLQLAKTIFHKIYPDKTFKYVSDKPFQYDVQKRVPSVVKAKKMLGFEGKTSLSEALDEIIPWIREQIKIGGI